VEDLKNVSWRIWMCSIFFTLSQTKDKWTSNPQHRQVRKTDKRQ